MALFSTILVPLDGSQTAALSLGCANWLAKRLGARLHLFSATSSVLPAREELARLNVPEDYWPQIMLHQAPEYPEDAVLAAIERYGVELLVMTAQGHTAEAQRKGEDDPFRIVGHVTRTVIEHSSVPVLLLPPRYKEALPWERALVPVSGEVEGNEALMFAVRLANALNLVIHVAHVSDSSDETGIAARARYADAAHHEYPGQLQELVNRSLPKYTPAECRCIQDVSLVRGDVGAELLALIERKRSSVIIIGWHGQFMAGHARVIKGLLRSVTCPLLLLKSAVQPPFRLKVGEDIE